MVVWMIRHYYIDLTKITTVGRSQCDYGTANREPVCPASP